jgi:hypothetical protein
MRPDHAMAFEAMTDGGVSHLQQIETKCEESHIAAFNP